MGLSVLASKGQEDKLLGTDSCLINLRILEVVSSLFSMVCVIVFSISHTEPFVGVSQSVVTPVVVSFFVKP